MREANEPAVYWLTHEEVLARQRFPPVCSERRSFPDPTANTAIGRVYRRQKEEQKEKGRVCGRRDAKA